MSFTSITAEQLSVDPHPFLRRMRTEAPVCWLPTLNAWLVTSYELCNQVMLDADGFTVDDPRFSTQQVIGPSMLSLDGEEHRRHRDPFGPSFRAGRIRELSVTASEKAGSLLGDVRERGSGDLRGDVAGPLAVELMAEVLDLGDVEPRHLLGWYREIVEAVHVVTTGGQVPERGHRAFESLRLAVAAASSSSSLLSPIVDGATLSVDEIVSNVAVLLFGGIVTTESAIAIGFHYLLSDRDLMERLQTDRSLIPGFAEETLRLEPSAAAVDRYTTRDMELGDVTVPAGDLVRVSLTAANRDPTVFSDPGELQVERENVIRNLTFARGPHACLGIHLARLEVVAAVGALLDVLAEVRCGILPSIEGLVFRAPDSVPVHLPGADATPS